MATPDPFTAPTPHPPVRGDWLGLRQEEILEPELPIVDPHHHLVERANTGRYLLPELLADTGSGHNITATVYLEWLSMYRAGGPEEMRPVGDADRARPCRRRDRSRPVCRQARRGLRRVEEQDQRLGGMS